ncbi:hypothetical protein K492DRAFT_171724 [Lichtheimia hyalospora FSU 10163]|nr:hypothetical protein K492DRAFT_171724 [Lichtheimia hyalospora FSU 10163]
MRFEKLSFFSTLVLLHSYCFANTLPGDIAPSPQLSPTAHSTATPSLTHTNSSVALASPTIAARLFEPRDDDPNSSMKDSMTKDKDKTTNANGETVYVNVTTVVVVDGDGNNGNNNDDPNKVYHDSNYANQQEQPPPDQSSDHSDKNMQDPNSNNDDDNVTEQLHQDQAALKRMVTILSVVGGVGAIAVVATLIIFTRMRARKRKQRELEEEADLRGGGEGNCSSDNSSRGDDSHIEEHPLDPSTTTATTTTGDDDGPMPIPSAPPAPAPFLASLHQSTYERRRNMVSIISQTTPQPSAPSAKELDAMADQQAAIAATSTNSEDHDIASGSRSMPSSQEEQESSKPQPSSSSCPHCEHHHHHQQHLSPLPPPPTHPMEPEAPPPAYTPSAPPLYILPQESLILGRRHSQA